MDAELVQKVLTYCKNNSGYLTMIALQEIVNNSHSEEGVSVLLNFLIDEGLIIDEKQSRRLSKLAWKVLSEYGTWLKYLEHLEKENRAKAEKEAIEFEKSKIDLKLAKKMLKEYPYTKWLARIGLLISIIALILSFLQTLRDN